jgi:hypothetical protein
MKFIISAFFAMFTVSAFAQTNLQYQAHAPAGTPSQSSFSVYLADNTFDENSHLNSNAFWYVENVNIEITNGIVNYTLENIPNNVLIQNQSNIFVYAYVNGQSLGKFKINKVPYSLKSEFSTNAENSNKANRADTAMFSISARYADTAFYSRYADTSAVSGNSWFAGKSLTSDFADTARAAGKATLSDLATYASTAAHSAKSDTAQYAVKSGLAFKADTSTFAFDANHSDFSSTSAFATNSARSVLADTAKTLIDNTIEHRNFKTESVRLSSLEGSSTAPIGSYATRGLLGISWEVNPHHKTNSVVVYTTAPLSLPSDSRWVVSRVAVDYNIATVTSPTTGQLVTIFNGSTANNITIKDSVWGTDTNLDYTLWPNQSRTLWYNGTDWVVVQ